MVQAPQLFTELRPRNSLRAELAHQRPCLLGSEDLLELPMQAVAFIHGHLSLLPATDNRGEEKRA